MGWSLSRSWNLFKLRAARQWLLGRAIRRGRRQLKPAALRIDQAAPDAVLCFVTQRNEMPRLPHFLNYYRSLGAGHFLFVDNGSTDGSVEYLRGQPDVTLFTTTASYKSSRFGMDWINYLLFRYGSGRWCLTVDPDELFVYPHCDTRPLAALTDWLDASGIRSFSAMLLDMYPRGNIHEQSYHPGDDPLKIVSWFDPANYTIHKNGRMGNLWIQGGPRARQFFPHSPAKAPALNKVPLVKWARRYVYTSSTHQLLPRSLNLVYDEAGGEKASGILLHTKFLSTFVEKSAEEMLRGQHYANSQEYRAYSAMLESGLCLWNEHSCQYEGWRQLEDLGLISSGNWA
ncbi:MAG: glycosyltransferase family 2 protein [Paracoccus sp. (in: a-proteobacteria)]|nr:glycosyltransferase family 2 protein [Paracoccus sp. (in: a-proteobacteria)]